MKHYGDITKLDGYTLPPVDIVTGGSPCQDLSVAGKREGLAGERSGLFMEQIRVIKEMRENDRRNGRTGNLVRPRYMVWENVPGAFSSNRGEDFRAVLEETARVADETAVIPRLAEKQKWPSSGAILGGGWSIAWRVHDAQFWGVPQRRKRISLVADFGGPTAPEILFERESVSGDLEPGAEEREETAGAVEGSPGTASYTLKIRGGADTYIKPDGSNGTEHHAVYDARGNGDGDVAPTITGDHENRITDYTAVVYDASRRHNYEPFGEVSETVQASYGTGGNNQPIVVENPSYQRTTGSLMASGYSILGTQEAANDMYIVQSQSWDGTQIAPTLTSNNAGGNQRMPDKDNFNAVVQSLETYHCTAEVDKVQTLKARDYKDPQVVTYGIDQQGGKGGASYTVDVSHTMASDSHGTPHGVCAAIDCRNGTEDTDVNASLQSASAHNINSNNVCRQNSVVRRLTPLECERLQGFPDGWTDIGDWVDSKGKLHKGEADSPRYKALGNSIALPFWEWMAKRMVKNLGEQPTMASLFDGIGGFPLVFSRCGCTPVWASEIEEFPIAVTKIHFPEKE